MIKYITIIMEENKKLTMIDLCAGTGAFTYAFESTKKVDRKSTRLNSSH